MSSTMEQLLFMQEDLSSRITKGRTNYKKTSKERKTKQLSQFKLEALEKLWESFVDNHAELCKTADPVLLKVTAYFTKDVFDTTEELYIDYKCLLTQDLHVESSAMIELGDSQLLGKSGGNKANIAKLPKIVIPKFTGDYTEWTTFRDLFISLVHDTDMDKAVKMQYLKGLLGGEAEQLVRNMSITTANYDKCWTTLVERYNNTRYLCNTILKRLFNQSSSNCESAPFLKEILDNTTECIGALAYLGVDVSTWDLIIIYMTSLKLDPESRKQWELESASITGNELPNFKTFQEFLTKRFRALEFVSTGSSSSKSKVVPRSFHVAEEASASVTCKFCNEQHKLVHCKSFENEEVTARRVFVEKQRLCFNCLGEGHSANQCRCRFSCYVCRRRHHTFLHLTSETDSKLAASSGSPEDSSSGEEAPVVCFASGGMAARSQVLLATALVKAETINGDTRILRASLDQGSQASFITEATAQHLGLQRTPVRGVISGVGGRHNVYSKAMVKLNISSTKEGFQNVKLTLNVFVLKSITTLLPSKQVNATEWVRNLSLADPGYNMPSRIDLLLGAEVVGQVMRDGIQKQGSLLAQNTSLGWILSGVASSNSNKQATNLIAMHQVCFEKDNQLKKLEAETKANIKSLLTEEKTRCEKFFEEVTRRDEEGRHDVKQSSKTEDLKVEKCERITEKRTYQEVKLNKTTELKAKCVEVLAENLHLDHTEKVPEKKVNKTKGTYLLHCAVVRYDKDITTARTVNDASCKENNGLTSFDVESAVKLKSEINNRGLEKQKRSSNSKKQLERIKETGKGVDKEDEIKQKTNKAIKLTWNRRNDAIQHTLTLPELVSDVLWFEDPGVLHKTEVTYDGKNEEETNKGELKVYILTSSVKVWGRLSNLGKLVRVVANGRRFITWKKRKKNKDQRFLTTQELKKAVGVCIKQCQKPDLTEKVASNYKSENGISAKLQSPFNSFNPFLDNKQRLNVGKQIEAQMVFSNPEPVIGDLVLVKQEGLPPSRWLLGRVITKHPGPDNITRVVSLRTKSNVMKRPTSKLCILPITA